MNKTQRAKCQSACSQSHKNYACLVRSQTKNNNMATDKLSEALQWTPRKVLICKGLLFIPVACGMYKVQYEGLRNLLSERFSEQLMYAGHITRLQ